jgi:hypothetical protein
MKMDPKLKARWVKALRSGRYKQARNTLKTTVIEQDEWELDGPRYCCLGVLCNIINPKGWEDLGGTCQEWTPPAKVGSEDSCTSELSEAVRRFAGLSSSHHQKLMRMNDLDHSTFREIADWIEAKL